MAQPAPLTAAELRASLASEWEVATRSHAFLRDVNAGTIRAARFNTWLAQDYHYVRAFVRLLASMLTACPEAHLETLVGGMAAIDVEIKWFQAKAAERGIDLERTAPQPACVQYVEFLATLRGEPYPVQAAAFWAMEAIYHEAWKGVGEGLADPKYQEFSDRWGSPGFGEYVDALARQADEALASAGPSETEGADAAVRRALELELGFWAMAYAGGEE